MVRREQPEKVVALAEGGVEDFILIFVKPVQLEKHHSPKLVTELGIFVFLQPAIIVFEEVSIIALQFSLES